MRERKKSSRRILTLLLAASATFALALLPNNAVAQVSPSGPSTIPVQNPSTKVAPDSKLPPTAYQPDQIDQVQTISLQEAIDRATKLPTGVTTADLHSKVAAEDVKQARAALLPKLTVPLGFIYNTPSLIDTTPHGPSFLGADAITVYEALLNAEGEIDTSGKLRTTIKKYIALQDAARAGVEIARRELESLVIEAYYGLGLATLKRRSAETSLRATLEFEENERLHLEAGEIAPSDLVRARLQSAQRRDELLQARTDEAIAANALRIALGIRLTEQISVEDLLIQLPVAGEIERYSEAMIRNRPELAQFEAERRAAEYELRSAKADRLPQLTYSVGSGFVTDSLVAGSVKNHAGVQATVGVKIPIFDWGATRSRIAQAEFRKQSTEAARQIAERDFIQEFYAARQQAFAARERIDLLRKSIADGETSVNTSIIRYRADEAPLTEVTDAQNTLLGLRASFYQALHDYQTAKARLARAAGH